MACPERRILRKLLKEMLAYAYIEESRLYVESWADLEPQELDVVRQLLAED